MYKNKFVDSLNEIFSSSRGINIFIFLLTALFFTALLSSKYFLFQSVINDDNISRKDIIATKTIEVVDTFRTEKKKKEVSQRIDPILKPAEDTYIKNNLRSIFNSIKLIRQKDISSINKKIEISTYFDIFDINEKGYIINHLVSVSDKNLEELIKKSNLTLENILNTGFNDKDFLKQNLDNIVRENAPNDATKKDVKIIQGMIEQVIVPNLIIDEKATELARKNASNSVNPYTITFEKGDKIVYEGELVTPLKRSALAKAGYNVLELNFKGVLGIFILCSLGILILIYYFKYYEKQYFNRNHLSIIALLAIFLCVIAVVIPDGWPIYLLPIPAFVIILSILSNSRIALFNAILLTAIISVALQFQLSASIAFILISMITAVATVKIQYSRRFDMVKIGFEIALAMLFVILSIYSLRICVADIDLQVLFLDSLTGVINGLLSGVLVLGMLPLLESWFKIITPYGLAELADHNQPLLKRLQYEAPGTFSHSLMVSNLCEAATEAVNGDPILARVGAFYHDIGKLKRPLFFVENQTYFGIENPHQKLNPKLSKMVITAHPKDGVDIAKEYNVPAIIQNFILQHHGNSLASYFYNQAIKEEGIENVDEDQYRYSCPKPNTKETAILMLADAVESASRTLKEYSQEEIEGLIDKIITERINDGQLSDSPLTLRDLKTVAQVFNRVLRAQHHQRIKYHENIIAELENKSKAKINTAKVLNDPELEKKIQEMEEKKNNGNS